MNFRSLLCLSGFLTLAAPLAAQQTGIAPEPAAPPEKKSLRDVSFRDPEDGYFDATDFILAKHGFLAVPVIITEPAVGYGGGAALLFLDYAPDPPPGTKPKRFVPPSITGVAGAMTENGTWFGGLFHRGIWQDDNLRYLGAVGRAHAVLSYYGSGGGGPELKYESDVWFLLQQIEKRVKDSNWFVGAKYLYLGPDTTFNIGNGNVPGIQPLEFDSATAGALAMVTYDSRNNSFTPTQGAKIEWGLGYYDDALGGDFSYGRLDAFNTFFWELDPKLSVGLRVEGHFTLGDGRVPFYHQPAINLRGVPAARYQGRSSLVTEVEFDWAVHPRWTLTFFCGDGRVTSDEPSDLADAEDVFGYGLGFRYLIARRLGIKAGIDFAWSDVDSAFYITVGNAWPR